MSEHTETPWRVHGGEAVLGYDDVWVKPYEADSWEGDRKWPDRVEAKANARHIVHCVNNHERLVNALSQMHAIAEFRESRNPEVIAAGELLAALEADKGGEL